MPLTTQNLTVALFVASSADSSTDEIKHSPNNSLISHYIHIKVVVGAILRNERVKFECS